MDYVKYLYPYDIYNLSKYIPKIKFQKNLINNSHDKFRFILEAICIHENDKSNFFPEFGNIINSFKILNIKNLQNNLTIYQQLRLKQRYKELTPFINLNFEFYQVGTNIIIIQKYKDYLLLNLKYIKKERTIHTIVLLNLSKKYVLSIYNWDLKTKKPIGHHVQYLIEYENSIDQFQKSIWYNSQGYVVAVDYLNNLYWDDNILYKRITLSVPQKILSHLKKWRQTPISLLEGFFETENQVITLYLYDSYDKKYDSYKYIVKSNHSQNSKIICPNGQNITCIDENIYYILNVSILLDLWN